MIYEVAKFTRAERRNFVRSMGGGHGKPNPFQCRKDLLNGKRCSSGAVIVRVKKDVFDKGTLKRTPFCRPHSDEELLTKLGITRFGGPTSTSGPNRGKPRTNPHKVMREMVEEHIIDFLKPYMEALTAEKEVVVGHGRAARVETVPDHRARMQAAESLFDRIYGKPKQSTVLEGGITVEPVEVPTDDQRQLEVAKILAAAGAVAPMAASDDNIKRAAKAGQN